MKVIKKPKSCQIFILKSYKFNMPSFMEKIMNFSVEIRHSEKNSIFQGYF